MQDMVKLIHQLSYRHSTNKVFADFVEMSAIALSNATDQTQYEPREKRYLEIIKHYKPEELNEFPKLLGMLVNHLEEAPQDVLGEVFHALELHNERKGQFFTPFPICRMMAKMIVGDSQQDIINQYGFITISEPACGTGAMIIAAAQELKDSGINYQQTIHVTAVDLDATCVHAAYVQFSLLYIPAVVIHGNSLSLEEFSHWYTPAHTLGFWDYKLKEKAGVLKLKEMLSNTTIDEAKNENFPVPNAASPSDTEKTPQLGTQLRLF